MPPELALGTSRKVMDADRLHPVNKSRMATMRQEPISVGACAAADAVPRVDGLLLKDAALERNDYGMSAVARFKFRQNALHVPLDGMHR
jgi:hypothetical protein